MHEGQNPLHAGKVRRVWKYAAYNAAWCGGPDE